MTRFPARSPIRAAGSCGPPPLDVRIACRDRPLRCPSSLFAAQETLCMTATDKVEAEVAAIRNRYEELAELAGSLAHEIKNPLSVIHMNIDLLSEDLAEIDSPIRRRALNK